ncbi:hypothetical protein IC229_33240 [Spirosoma sp. BT702]|uniref:Uncharacterized protein n=1 Tax=Spirosoma profusum TaxID=2771354 RepID=A0A927AW39_9BACT|nr:hypothetical protein [Spirosoma profusum]MBD2705523.1 hypothetical protein [Spirosoma profusum]
MVQFNPFVCPKPAALTTIPSTDCPVRWDQVIAMAFHRKGTPIFTSTTIKATGTWTDAIADTDNGKVTLTPAFSGWTFPKSEITIEGENDNSTIGGMGSIGGGNVIRPMGTFRNKSSAAMKALSSYTSESSNDAAPQVEVFFITVLNQIIANSDGTGFDATNIAVSDTYSDGLKKDNMNDISISLPYGWSFDATLFTPTFDIKALLPK